MKLNYLKNETVDRRPLLCALVLLLVNVAIVAKLFGVEFLAYPESNEGSFIAIARLLVEHPGQWSWWPYWSGGMPFENSYLPLTHWIVAVFSVLSGFSPARSFHFVAAAVYALGAPALFWMALSLSRRLTASFVAGLAYSCFSLSALIFPAIRVDAQGLLGLRRLQVVSYYGEAPQTLALALLPLAVVCFSRALTTTAVRWKILAGALMGAIVLSNAFGAVTLAIALVSWLLAFRTKPWWKGPAIATAIGILSYCWISPWLSPSMIRAIRTNAPTVEGDYRYTASSWIALAVLVCGYLLLWLILRRAKVAEYLQFFALFGYVPLCIVLGSLGFHATVLPQPSRYHLGMDMALLLPVVFGAAAILDRFPRSVRSAAAALVLAALTLQAAHSAHYARHIIRSIDPAQLVEYQIAKWMDHNRPGERAFIGGSSSFWYNVFTDNPQFHGGHDPSVSNPFFRIPVFTIYSGMNAGERDADYSLLWLKAYGAHAISVSGPNGREYYKPFQRPLKFEGRLPVLWRQGGDVIYEVPSRSPSLAHVIPAAAVPARTPINGLDIGPVEPYVAALDDPRYPLAGFRWTSLSEAEIHARVEPGQVIAVQVTYDSGWKAYDHGRPLRVRGDSIGLMVIEPDSSGPCDVSLRFTGGTARIVTRALSLAAMLVAAAFAWTARRRVSTAALAPYRADCPGPELEAKPN